MKQLLSCLFFLCASVTWAQPLPALYDVADVAASDRLNIRADASAKAELIGSLAPNAKDIEVVALSDDKQWGLVNTGEAAGWVSMRYLRRHEDTGDYALTRRLRCFGTEPFWSLDIVQGGTAAFSAPDGVQFTRPAGLLQSSANRADRYMLGVGDLHAVIARQSCSDGMSDRAFGLSIDIILPAPENRLLSGCCRLVAE